MNFFAESYTTLNGHSENMINNTYFNENKGYAGQKWFISASKHAQVVPPSEK